MDSQSVVFDQAGNRIHAQKGLLVWLLDKQP
jgi:ornithine carbamoyltransferase